MTGMLPLSAQGTLRTILVLVVLWLLLRMVLRMQQARQAKPPGTHWAPMDGRRPGDVRVERAEGPGGRPGADGTVEDADHEEIR